MLLGFQRKYTLYPLAERAHLFLEKCINFEAYQKSPAEFPVRNNYNFNNKDVFISIHAGFQYPETGEVLQYVTENVVKPRGKTVWKDEGVERPYPG